MKAIFSMALVVGLCGLGSAQGDKADPVGTWKCEYKIGDQMRTLELTIKKDGDKLAGMMTWPDQKDEKLTNVKLKAGTLTFSAVRKFMDKEFPLDFTLKIDGEKRSGVQGQQAGVRHRREAREEEQVTVARETPLWQAWMGERFPMLQMGSALECAGELQVAHRGNTKAHRRGMEEFEYHQKSPGISLLWSAVRRTIELPPLRRKSFSHIEKALRCAHRRALL